MRDEEKKYRKSKQCDFNAKKKHVWNPAAFCILCYYGEGDSSFPSRKSMYQVLFYPFLLSSYTAVYTIPGTTLLGNIRSDRILTRVTKRVLTFLSTAVIHHVVIFGRTGGSNSTVAASLGSEAFAATMTLLVKKSTPSPPPPPTQNHSRHDIKHNARGCCQASEGELGCHTLDTCSGVRFTYTTKRTRCGATDLPGAAYDRTPHQTRVVVHTENLLTHYSVPVKALHTK